jgi:UDP-N-acetylmuramoyl-L-alanyl-D-glutamate--2,6-diaminopimelate ligase
MTPHALSEVDVAALLARLGARPRRITSDSRAVEPGVAFAAYPGASRDGRTFIPDAVQRGAGAVLWERLGFDWDASIAVPNQPVEGLKHNLGSIADFIYGSPSRALWTIGVTGTNGKTSCTQWIAQAFEQFGRSAAVIGTLGSGFVGALEPAPNTTPDAALLQETLARLKEGGAQVVAMEVSSIGLAQDRVNGMKFDVTMFTNLSRDHLDYHGTMAAYGAAKARLFAWPTLLAAVINTDDDFGKGLVDQMRDHAASRLTYGLSGAEITATSVITSSSGMTLGVATPWGRGELQTSLVGTFNASNLLGTLGVLLASGVALDDALAAMAVLRPPPGRMERHGGGERPLVVIDYAHTPDALQQILTALRPSVRDGASLVCVFGAGGDRDPGKRPEMGRIAASLADRVVVTSDNPRSEDPTAIAMSIAQGVRAAGNRHWILEIDRAKAIRGAIAAGRPGDVIVLAGKGHETHQEIAGEKHPFSDAAEAASALAEWSGG